MIIRMRSFIFILLGVLTVKTYTAELLKNNDFESSFNGNWNCNNCKLTSSTDTYHGHHSAMISHRSNQYATVKQTITVKTGHHYTIKGFFKLLNMAAGHSYTDVYLMASVHINGKAHYYHINNLPMQQVRYGWTEIGGDFVVPQGVTTASIYVQILEPSINFLLDNFSIQELLPNSNWKSDALQRINSIRKAKVTIGLAGASSDAYHTKLIQKKHEFAFGSAVDASKLIDPSYKPYHDFIYNNFEWAVLENALKWRLMEWTKDHTRYDVPMNAINDLLSHGLKIRGHNMFWAVDRHAPSWLAGMTQSQLTEEMKSHVKEMISHTRGKLQHWDVNNENLHGDYYERHTGNINITGDMFRWIHDLEPNVKLFINDFNIVSSTICTTSVKNQALNFKKDGVPVYGIGVQSHFKSSNVDMTTLKYRLDKVAEAGLPIWVTELSVLDSNENTKADALENIATMMFSHPAVEGMLLWGFWDRSTFDVKASLATGPNVTTNAAGKRYLNLIHHNWTTNRTLNIMHGSYSNVYAFHGDYELQVLHHNKVVHVEHFTLDKTGKNITVHLQDDDHISHIAFG